MIILGISSSTSRHSAAIWEDGHVLAEVFVGVPFRHSEYLPVALSEVFTLSEKDPSSIDCIAVDVGPGLFTGLRAGVAVAKSVSCAVGKPMIAVPSLWVLAHRLYRVGHERAIVIADARRHELYWQVFPPDIRELATILAQSVSTSREWGSELGIRLGSIEELMAELQDFGPRLFDYTVAGEGALLYKDRIVGKSLSVSNDKYAFGSFNLRIVEEFSFPTASGVAMTAFELANSDPQVMSSADNVRAIYMRSAHAKRLTEQNPKTPVPFDVFIE